jgi:hypothetical protein
MVFNEQVGVTAMRPVRACVIQQSKHDSNRDLPDAGIGTSFHTQSNSHKMKDAVSALATFCGTAA